MKRIATTATAFALVVCTMGCGGETTPGSGDEDDYPLVKQATPGWGPAVTTENGAVVRPPLKPTVYATKSRSTCERALASTHDGSKPTRRPVVIPPAPGIRASAVAEREVVIEWTFRSLPRDCTPESVRLSIVANADVGATPTNQVYEVDGKSGSARLRYPEFLAPPDVAHASASTEDGTRSRTTSVLIRR